MGAYPIAVRDIVATLYHGAHRTMGCDSVGIQPGCIRVAAAAHRAGNLGGRIAFDFGRRISGAAAKSARRSVRAGSFERRGAGRDAEPDYRAAHGGRDSARGVRGRGGDHRGGLFSGPARRTTGQRDVAARGNCGGVVSFGDYYFSADDGDRHGTAQHDVLADGRFDGAASDDECAGLVRIFVFDVLWWRRARCTRRLPI